MNKENMLKWAEALESGQYKQYRGGWNNGHGGKSLDVTQHCCLDVACMLFEGGKTYYEFVCNITAIMRPHLDLDTLSYEQFMTWNDIDHLSFTEIAARIRKMVEEA